MTTTNQPTPSTACSHCGETIDPAACPTGECVECAAREIRCGDCMQLDSSCYSDLNEDGICSECMAERRNHPDADADDRMDAARDDARDDARRGES